MIIEKIELENFLCYSGNVELKFKEGLNVVIGDNGYGKSKLYDAFYWVLYDQTFSSELKRFQYTKETKSNLISDKAKFEVENGRINSRVSITFLNDRNQDCYTLERKYSVNKINGETIESNDSEFIIWKREYLYSKSRIVSDEEEKKRILNNIMPVNIKDYLWFQGEQVESIIDFNNQDTLTKAINVLSNIKRYDEIKEIAINCVKAVNNEYDKEVKRLSKDSDKSESLSSQKEIINRKIETQLDEERELKKNLARAEEKINEILTKIDDASKIRDFQNKKKNAIKNLESLTNELEIEQIGFHRKMFKNKWLLKGTTFLHDSYSKLYDEYVQEKLKSETAEIIKSEHLKELNKKLQSRLPINVPEPIHVKRMLQDEWCYVCDREAKKGSEAFEKIESLLRIPESEDIKNKVRNFDFSLDLKKLYHVSLGLNQWIQNIDDNINETLLKIRDLNLKIRDIRNELEKIEEDIQKIISVTSLNPDEANNILSTYYIQKKYEDDFREKLNNLNQTLELNRQNLSSIEVELASLVTGTIPEYLTAKKQILRDFEAIAINTRERVFDKLIIQLENEANIHYSEMTTGNRSTKGQIKLKRKINGNYMPEIIDSDGNTLLGTNTSNLIMVKLSVIMAIISAKSDSGENYTLITDAPTSVFGEDYTFGFCKTISKVYKQSIVMSKEFYNNQKLRNELLTNHEIKIGKVYTVIPTILESERSNRNNLITQVHALN
ncbi:hypothetical protein SanaruYs_34570 [Chryseotalea sanaruensis]|uniref:RecF/RecN/SMC N-terminal domain-containing protein n=1 Tax=Chryseotalea sanaruensis TaxID=2482724 RepID=A0A401UED8_9BACT|nr:AAA family ATPase [Chryseotalea sanaruensis]GCC53214.1 hypothetical protein SanaruYs_34570 [Chryseotalea sanaruensis]